MISAYLCRIRRLCLPACPFVWAQLRVPRKETILGADKVAACSYVFVGWLTIRCYGVLKRTAAQTISVSGQPVKFGCFLDGFGRSREAFSEAPLTAASRS